VAIIPTDQPGDLIVMLYFS